MAAELWNLRSWLDVQFMKKMEAESFEAENLELGKANVDVVRKYFNMK